MNIQEEIKAGVCSALSLYFEPLSNRVISKKPSVRSMSLEESYTEALATSAACQRDNDMLKEQWHVDAKMIETLRVSNNKFNAENAELRAQVAKLQVDPQGLGMIGNDLRARIRYLEAENDSLSKRMVS